MIKKLIKQFMPACFLLFGVFASCTSDGEPDSPGLASGISLRFQTSAGDTRSSVDIGTEAENQIQNIHLWFFAGNVSDTDKALFYTSESPALASSELVLNYTDEVLKLHGMNSEGSYKLLAVANLPDGVAIGEQTTLSDLKRYFYTAANRPNSPFCMTGSTNGAHNFSINSQVTIPLLRVVSRLDITIVNASGKTLQVNKVSIMNDQQSVQLFAPDSDAAAPDSDTFAGAADIYTTPTVADEVKCSSYVYENRSAASTEVVIEGSIDGNAATWTVPIKPDGSTILPRNSICKTAIRLKGITPTDVAFTISEWNQESIETSFPNTYIDLDKTEVEVFYLQGGVLGVQSNAPSILVNWEAATGFYLAGYEDVKEATLSITNNHTALTFYSQGTSDAVIPDGIVTVTTGNLKKTITLKKENSNVIFMPRIVLARHEIHEGDTIPGDFWGSLNQEELLYVNSYTNLTWAYQCKVNSAESGDQILEFGGRSTFNGTVGDSSIDGPLGAIPVFNSQTGLNILLPINATVTFYLNDYMPPWNGTILYTLHFTIA